MVSAGGSEIYQNTYCMNKDTSVPTENVSLNHLEK